MSSSHDTPGWPGQGQPGPYGQPVPPPPPPPPPPPGPSQAGSGQSWTIPAGGQGWTGYQGGYQSGYQNWPGSQAWPPAPPAGAGGPGGAGGQRGRRIRRSLAVAVVAAAVGAASTFLGLHHAGGTSGSAVLTTKEVASKVDPALVDINTTLGYAQEEAAGTGLVLTSNGEILTNNHVIEGATTITATDVGNGHTYKAKVVGYDRSQDIAVIQLQNASGLDTVTLGSSSTAQVGQKVVAIGNAEGKGGIPSVVTGQILALNASITASDASAGTSERLHGLIKHDAPIEPGDSGGPLVNTSGEVIGIDTAASTSDFQIEGQAGQTQGYSIPINEAVSIARQIEAGTSSADVHIGATGFVGVDVEDSSVAEQAGVPANDGALVAGIVAGSPAQAAGLSPGDVITSVGGQRVTSSEDLQQVLEQRHPGDKVTIGWSTGQLTDNGRYWTSLGKHQTATVTLASGPAG